jgi:hypothetical protein
MLIPNVILASASVKLVFLKGLTESSILQYRRRSNHSIMKIAVGLLNLPKNNPVAMAKLNKPINASAAESALVKTDWTMPITNCSEGLCTKKISLSKFYPFTVSTCNSI